MTDGDADAQAVAQRAADRLATALEDGGFDVGRDFPVLHDAVGRQGVAVVRLGDVRPVTAERPARVLSDAAGAGIVITEEGDR
ncbi:hypothetical protein [Mangrovihabitans endophyticus]|uniref:Uncharacterized protein n=1 Tax=Mangrovihabitans endophyticus TaxID=1751298 RepID=A0A8J3BS75_9ACTN|nr:hypothetical protein [Mangrovihabitans endophyticus]GGK72487.1 hypothetical protein GCM10012284_02870 [Mangrovihabitans endophyticus]